MLSGHQQLQQHHTWAIAIGCLTRWGSHYSTIKAIHKARKALEQFALDPRVQEALEKLDAIDTPDKAKNSVSKRLLEYIRNK